MKVIASRSPGGREDINIGSMGRFVDSVGGFHIL